MNASFDWTSPAPGRWTGKRRTVVVVAVAAVLVGVGVGLGVATADHSDSHAHRRHAPAWFIVLEIVGFVISMTLIWVSLIRQRRACRREGISFWRPEGRALPWRARRELGRGVRAGRLSTDPARRRYEIDGARRLALSWTSLRLTGLGLLLLQGIRVLDPTASGLSRVVAGAVSVVWVIVLPVTYRSVRGARQILAADAALTQNGGGFDRPSSTGV